MRHAFEIISDITPLFVRSSFIRKFSHLTKVWPTIQRYFQQSAIENNFTSIIDLCQIWNTQDNSNLPYFYGSVGKENPRLFGVAMDAPAPMKISFGIRKSTAMTVESVQLGGDFNMLLFLGPSRRDVATQFIQAFGKYLNILG